MPYYNRYDQLMRSIRSIEEIYAGYYEYDDIEIVIVDDGSDVPLDLVDTYFQAYIERLPKSRR